MVARSIALPNRTTPHGATTIASNLFHRNRSFFFAVLGMEVSTITNTRPRASEYRWQPQGIFFAPSSVSPPRALQGAKLNACRRLITYILFQARCASHSRLLSMWRLYRTKPAHFTHCQPLDTIKSACCITLLSIVSHDFLKLPLLPSCLAPTTGTSTYRDTQTSTFPVASDDLGPTSRKPERTDPAVHRYYLHLGDLLDEPHRKVGFTSVSFGRFEVLRIGASLQHWANGRN